MPFQDDSVFESLKDWVLTVSMDNSIDFSSDMNIANEATSSDSGKVFEACATSKDKVCCITGEDFRMRQKRTVILTLFELVFPGYPIRKAPSSASDIRSVGTFSFSINNSDRGLLQTAKVTDYSRGQILREISEIKEISGK